MGAMFLFPFYRVIKRLIMCFFPVTFPSIKPFENKNLGNFPFSAYICSPMSDNNQDNKPIDPQDPQENKEDQDIETFSQEEEEDMDVGHSDYKPLNRFDASQVRHLGGMYQNWFLDYASYVILERAVPHIGDGLKPVQRRILHSMKRMDDGRYNKVANIVGHTMQFHPHGDASIGDALVGLGQKGLLVDTQGNWGNILTGDRAAAPRYIEARLSKFALETVFNPKTTSWQLSYDGRNKEPITLPVKFPLLLAQGAEGIAVGLSSKILPHNFCELCDASIAWLYGKPFTLYPDFPTGGYIDVSKYNDGQRGGLLKVRAKIEKLDSKTLVIREIPFGKTTSSLIDSILKAIEKGKIKARKVDDNTAAQVEILVHLAPGASSDKTIDALYAFSDCEINISPNCCVIDDKKPRFTSVSDVLASSTSLTMSLLRKELQIRRAELLEQLQAASLERIFIDERIYKDKPFEQAPDIDSALQHISKRLQPFVPQLVRPITRDDLLKLLEIKMQRILKFSKDKADELIARIRSEIEDIDRKLSSMTEVTADWFRMLKNKYGKDHPRLTEIRNFDTIQASSVAEANQKLYINRQEGFIGTSLKKDEFLCSCSDLDDIILFHRDGKYKIVRVADKLFVGKNVIYAGVFRKNDERTVYNVVYRDGKKGPCYIKRFSVTSITRDREYDLSLGNPGSRIMYFSANLNGEAETIKIILEPSSAGKGSLFMEKDFSDIMIKGRSSRGNLLTKKLVHKISLKSHGRSTLGGRKVWFDSDVARLNHDSHGILLGEFFDGDQILVVLESGEFYQTSFDTNNHYESNIRIIEKYDPAKIWTAILLDNDNDDHPYLKRFLMEPSKKKQNFLGDNPNNRLLCLSGQPGARFRLTFSGDDSWREPLDIDSQSFISVKSFRAKGKRLTLWNLSDITELEPATPEPSEYATEEDDPDTQNDSTEQADYPSDDPDYGKSEQQIRDEINGQLTLFPDEFHDE